MANEKTSATATAKTAVKRRARKPKSDLQGRFEGLVKLVNEQKLINLLATKLNINAAKAKGKLYAVITRVGKGEGLVSKRSQGDIELVFASILELKPTVAEFVNDVKTSITYRSNKTGKRDGSWIRDLLAGVPRIENGVYKAYVEISKEEAQAKCDEMAIDLPTEDEEDAEFDGEEVEGAEETEE